MAKNNRNDGGQGRANSESQRGGKSSGVLELPGYEVVVPNHTYVSSELPKV